MTETQAQDIAHGAVSAKFPGTVHSLVEMTLITKDKAAEAVGRRLLQTEEGSALIPEFEAYMQQSQGTDHWTGCYMVLSDDSDDSHVRLVLADVDCHTHEVRLKAATADA